MTTMMAKEVVGRTKVFDDVRVGERWSSFWYRCDDPLDYWSLFETQMVMQRMFEVNNVARPIYLPSPSPRRIARPLGRRIPSNSCGVSGLLPARNAQSGNPSDSEMILGGSGLGTTLREPALPVQASGFVYNVVAEIVEWNGWHIEPESRRETHRVTKRCDVDDEPGSHIP